MVRIKLVRTGAKNRPSYRLIVVEKRRKLDGKVIETLGFYDPKTKPSTTNFNRERYLFWVGKGAQPSETVQKLINRHG